jgi:2-isopropylmalate synthase
MSAPAPARPAPATAGPATAVESSAAFTLERWSATSGNARLSRASLAIRGAGRTWRAHATGNGAVDALMRAVDMALAPFLGAGVELQTYNVHATGEGHDAVAAVTLSLRARSDDPHAPAYPGRGAHENVLEASLLAYVDAINRFVAHGNVDVASAAPPLGEGEPPGRLEEPEGRRGHGRHFTDLYNR